MTFHDHSRIGVSLRFTLPLMSREASEPSLALFMRSARWLSSVTISKSYFGLPQFWAFQSGGRPLVPTAGFVQSSTTIWPCACLLYTSDAADERSSVDLGG